MSIVLSTCAVIITVIIVLVALEFIDTLKQIKTSASAIEKLARDANNRVAEVEPVFKIVNSISSSINNAFSSIANKLTSIFK
ncbi:MAG: hypothetical protein K6357_01905 [Elusimicrobiota bacterium]